jgi:colicin import membrane protein
LIFAQRLYSRITSRSLESRDSGTRCTVACNPSALRREPNQKKGGELSSDFVVVYVAEGGNKPVERGLMARKLRTYQTSLGFYDLALAAPSMKAALEAWGAESNLFHQGVAKESKDPEVVAATMAKPGVILRRPVGSNGPFTEHAALPADLADDEVNGNQRGLLRSRRSSRPKRLTTKAARQAALEYDRAERQRESERRKEEAARAKERQRREQAINKAQDPKSQTETVLAIWIKAAIARHTHTAIHPTDR